MENWTNEDHAKYNQMETNGLININKIKINSERRGNQLYQKISNAIGKQPQSAKNVNNSSREQRLLEQFPKLDRKTLERMVYPKMQPNKHTQQQPSQNHNKTPKFVQTTTNEVVQMFAIPKANWSQETINKYEKLKNIGFFYTLQKFYPNLYNNVINLDPDYENNEIRRRRERELSRLVNNNDPFTD
jgi:hypothetical protein